MQSPETQLNYPESFSCRGKDKGRQSISFPARLVRYSHRRGHILYMLFMVICVINEMKWFCTVFLHYFSCTSSVLDLGHKYWSIKQFIQQWRIISILLCRKHWRKEQKLCGIQTLTVKDKNWLRKTKNTSIGVWIK